MNQNVCETIICPNPLYFPLTVKEDLWKIITFSFPAYSNYLLLFNKPLRNLVAQNKFCHTTSWLFWLTRFCFGVRMFHAVSVWNWRAGSPWLLRVCVCVTPVWIWLEQWEAVFPRGLSTWLALASLQIGGLAQSDSRGSILRNEGQSGKTSYELALEIPDQHFCHIFLVKQVSKMDPDSWGEWLHFIPQWQGQQRMQPSLIYHMTWWKVAFLKKHFNVCLLGWTN